MGLLLVLVSTGQQSYSAVTAWQCLTGRLTASTGAACASRMFSILLAVLPAASAWACCMCCYADTAAQQLINQLLYCCCVTMQELASFLKIQSSMQLVVDSSPQNELLKITFNIR
jgi:hypothetical protein